MAVYDCRKTKEEKCRRLRSATNALHCLGIGGRTARASPPRGRDENRNKVVQKKAAWFILTATLELKSGNLAQRSSQVQGPAQTIIGWAGSIKTFVRI